MLVFNRQDPQPRTPEQWEEYWAKLDGEQQTDIESQAAGEQENDNWIDWGDGKGRIYSDPDPEGAALWEAEPERVVRKNEKNAGMVLEEFLEHPGASLPWLGAQREAKEMFELHHAATLYDQARSGKYDWEDPEVVDAMKRLAYFMEDQQTETTWAYDFFSLLKDLPAFYGEFGLARKMAGVSQKMGMRGLAKVVKDATTEAASLRGRKGLLKKVGREMSDYVKKEFPAALKTYGAMEIPNIASWAMGGHGGRTSASAYRRALPNMTLQYDELDTMQLAMDDSLTTFWESLPAGIADQLIETLSEQFGSSQLMKRSKGLVARTPGLVHLRALQHQIVGDLMKAKRVSGFLEAGNKMLKKGGWDGMVEEWLEERFGSNLRTIFLPGQREFLLQEDEEGNTVLNWDRLTPDWKQWSVEAAAFAVPGATVGSIDMMSSRENYVWRRRMDEGMSLGGEYVPHDPMLGILSADYAAFEEETGQPPISEQEAMEWVNEKWQTGEAEGSDLSQQPGGEFGEETEEPSYSDQELEEQGEVDVPEAEEAEMTEEDRFPSGEEVAQRQKDFQEKLDSEEMEEERSQARQNLVDYLEETYELREGEDSHGLGQENISEIINETEDEELRQLANETGDYPGIRHELTRIDNKDLDAEIVEGLESTRRKLETDEEAREGESREVAVNAVEPPSQLHARQAQETLSEVGIELQYVDAGYINASLGENAGIEGGGVMGQLVTREGKPDVMLIDHRLPVTHARDGVAGVVAHEAWHPRFTAEEELLTEYLRWAEEASPEELEQSREEVRQLYESVFDEEAYQREVSEDYSEEEFLAWQESKIDDEVGAFTAQRLAALTHAMKIPGSRDLVTEIATGQRAILDDLMDSFKAVGNLFGGQWKSSYETKLARLQQVLDQLDPTGGSLATTENAQLALALEAVMKQASLGYYRNKVQGISAEPEEEDYEEEPDEGLDEYNQVISFLQEDASEGNAAEELARVFDKSYLVTAMTQWNPDTKEYWGTKDLYSWSKRRLAETIVEHHDDQVEQEERLEQSQVEEVQRRIDAVPRINEALERLGEEDPKEPVDVAELQQRGTGQQLITGEEETEELAGERTGEGLPPEQTTQIGLFDEQGGLFEAEAEARDQGGEAAPAAEKPLDELNHIEAREMHSRLMEEFDREAKSNKNRPPRQQTHTVLNKIWALNERMRELEPDRNKAAANHEKARRAVAEVSLSAFNRIKQLADQPRLRQQDRPLQLAALFHQLEFYDEMAEGKAADIAADLLVMEVAQAEIESAQAEGMDQTESIEGLANFSAITRREHSRNNIVQVEGAEHAELHREIARLMQQLDQFARIKWTKKAYSKFQDATQELRDRRAEYLSEQEQLDPEDRTPGWARSEYQLAAIRQAKELGLHPPHTPKEDMERTSIELDPEFKVVYCVSCGNQKSASRAKGRDMYTSSIFKRRMQLAEAAGHAVVIISGKHGVLDPDQLIDPYNERMPTGKNRQAMVEQIARQLSEKYGNKARYVVLGSKDYAGVIEAAVSSMDYETKPEVEAPQSGMGIPQAQKHLTEELERHGVKKKRAPKKQRSRKNTWGNKGKKFNEYYEAGKVDLIDYLRQPGGYLSKEYFPELWAAVKEVEGLNRGSGGWQAFRGRLFADEGGAAPDEVQEHLGQEADWAGYVQGVDERSGNEAIPDIETLLAEALSGRAMLPLSAQDAEAQQMVDEDEAKGLDKWLIDAQDILDTEQQQSLHLSLPLTPQGVDARWPKGYDAESADEVFWDALEYAIDNPGVLELSESQQALAEEHKKHLKNKDANSPESKKLSQELDPDGDVADVDDLSDPPFALRPDAGEAANPNNPYWSAKAVRALSQTRVGNRKWTSVDQVEKWLLDQGVTLRELTFLNLSPLFTESDPSVSMGWDSKRTRAFVPNREVINYASQRGLTIREIDMPAVEAAHRSGMRVIDGWEQAGLEHKVFGMDREMHKEIIQFQLTDNPLAEHDGDVAFDPNVLAEVVWDTRNIGTQGEAALFIHEIKSRWSTSWSLLGERDDSATDRLLEDYGWVIQPYGMRQERGLKVKPEESDPAQMSKWVAFNHKTRQYLAGIEAVEADAYQGAYSFNPTGAHRFESANAARSMVGKVLPKPGPWTGTEAGNELYLKRVLQRAVREAAGRGQSMLSWAQGSDVVDQAAKKVSYASGSFREVEWSIEGDWEDGAIELRFVLNDEHLGKPDGLSDTGRTVIELELGIYEGRIVAEDIDGPDGQRVYEPWEILGHRVWGQIQDNTAGTTTGSAEIAGAVWHHELLDTYDRDYARAASAIGLDEARKRTVTVGSGSTRVAKEAWVIDVPEEILEDVGTNGADTFALRPDRDVVVQDTIFKRFTFPRETFLEVAQRKIQDYFNRVSSVQKHVAAQGGVDAAIHEEIDVYLAEELFGGRLMDVMNLQKLDYLNDLKAIIGELKITNEQLILERDNDRRLAEVEVQAKEEGWSWLEKRKAVKEAKFDLYRQNLEELGWYMYALHAEERNAVLAERFPALYGSAATPGSGMTRDDAETIIDKVEGFDTARREAFLEMVQIVRDMNEASLQMRVDAGLTSAVLAEHWRTIYKNYVPLRSDLFSEDDPQGRSALAGGFDIRGYDLFAAKGRRSLADNPVVFSIMQYQTNAIRAEKNRVANTFYEFVKANPDETQWQINEVNRGSVDEWQRRPVSADLYEEVQERAKEEGWDADKLQEVLAQLPAVSTATEEAARRADREDVAVKVNGVEYRIKVTDPLIVRALKKLGTLESPRMLQKLFGGPTRMLARMNTAFDPQFILRNAIKDLQTASINLQQYRDSDIQNFTTNVVKNWRNGYRGTVGVGKVEAKGEIKSVQEWSEWEQSFLDFRAAGGKTSIWASDDYRVAAAKIQGAAKASDPSNPYNILQAVADMGLYVERVNEGVENALRVSAFHWARQAKESGGLGLSDARAASVAKNLTVNFNRKGEWGPVINTMYMFANASIQSNFIVFKNVAKYKPVRRVAMALFVGGMMQEIMNNIMGDDDEEFGLPRSLLIPEYEKERAIVFLVPPGTLRPELEDRVKMPLGWGFHLFWYAGTQMAAVLPREMMGSGKPVSKAAVDIFKAVVNNFNILGSGTAMQMVSPTLGDPIAMSAENKRWTGAPLRPEQTPYSSYDVPASELHWGNVHPTSKQVATWWNEKTGGDEFRSGQIGGIDVSASPEDLEEWFDFFTAGPGRFISQTTKLYKNPDLQVEDVPFVRLFLGGKPERMANEFYYKAREELSKLKASRESTVGTKSVGEQRRQYKQYAPFIDLLPELESTEKQIKDWRQMAKDDGYEEGSASLKYVDLQINSLRADFLRNYFQAADGNIWWQY